MAVIETHVVVPVTANYKAGPGYRGPLLRSLGFPEGPYIFGVAKLFVRQAAKLDPTVKFKIVEYVKE